MEKPQWVRVLAWFWQTRLGRSTLLLLTLAVASALTLLPVMRLDREFRRMEDAAIQRDATRIVDSIQNELRVLNALSEDWAVWDDTYAFMADRNTAFQKANLDWNSLLNNTHVQLIYFLARNGDIVWGGFHPMDAAQSTSLSAFTQERIGELPLLLLPRKEAHSGLFLTPDGPILLVSQPIRPSSNRGPSRGTLLMGRLLDPARMNELASLLAIPFQARDTLRQPLDPADASAWAHRGWAPWIRNQSEGHMEILVTVPDMYGRDRIVFTLPWERAIHLQGTRASRFVFLAVLLSLLAVAGALLLAFLHHLRWTRSYQNALEAAVTKRTAELQEAERRFRAFIDHTPDLMFWCKRRESDDCFVMEGANPAGLRFMGLPLQAIIGRRPQELLPAGIAESMERHVQTCSRQGTPLINEDALEVRGLRMVLQTAYVPVPDEGGRIHLIAGSARDITPLRDKEENLLHAQKLESLGVLAGGIAHDFNNILTAAQCNLDICAFHTAGQERARPYLEGVRNALTKAATLTRQMLTYAGRGRVELQVHDLNVAVQEMTELLHISISKKAELVCDLADHLPPIEADVAQIQQVIMNLVTNASDALQGRSGTIHVRTWTESLDLTAIARLLVQFMTPGLHVVLEVSDTGSGIPPEVQARIFDPFFSTKGVGRGLGLSAMLGIIRSHRGGLALESVPGEGTRFKLWFPASFQIRNAAEAEEMATRDVAISTGTVLLVEDDPSIRDTAGRLLQNLGFLVIEARDGMEGLERFHRHCAGINLILLDLTMPKMDGREFLVELRKSAPALPVIVSSGYTEQDLPSGDSALFFLQKPYRARDLRKAVLEAIDHAP